MAGGLAEELRVGHSALIQPKVVGNDRVTRRRVSLTPSARPPSACSGEWEESGMIKIGVFRHFLQRGSNSQLVPRGTPSRSTANFAPPARSLSTNCEK